MFDGTNAGVANGGSIAFDNGTASFIFDSTGTLYFDPNGANVADSGYSVVGTVSGDAVADVDLEIVATL